MQTRVRALNRSDGPALFELRRLSYAASPDFTVEGGDACLAWSDEDDGALVLGAFDERGVLVATMRGQILTDQESLGRQAALAASMPPLYPTLYLSRAATRPERSCAGLNASLRLSLLDFAFANEVRSLSGMITDHAVRSRTLLELGYRFYGDITEDEGLVARTGPWRLVVLDLVSDGRRALERLRAICEAPVTRRTLTGPKVWAGPRA